MGSSVTHRHPTQVLRPYGRIYDRVGVRFQASRRSVCDMGFGGLGAGVGVWDLGSGVEGLGFGIWGLGFRVWGSRFGV